MKRFTALITTLAIVLSLTACSDNSTTEIGTSTSKEETTTTATTTSATTTTSGTTAAPPTTSLTTSATTIQTTTTPVQTTTTVSTTTAPEWTENAYSATLYVNTACYSRIKAIQGSQTAKSYTVNTAVKVVAKTSTNYCKLDGGTYIHSDYLSDNKITVVTTPVTTAKPVTTTAVQTTAQKSYKLTKSDCDEILKQCDEYAESIGCNYKTAKEIGLNVGEVYKNMGYADQDWVSSNITRTENIDSITSYLLDGIYFWSKSDSGSRDEPTFTVTIDYTTVGKFKNWLNEYHPNFDTVHFAENATDNDYIFIICR